MMRLEVILTPAELPALRQRDLRDAVCVVFDVLRATSTIVTALANGAVAVMPVEEISEALALRRQQPGLLLAGERNGVRIRAAQAGGIDFDFGNSPREFTAENVRGKTIVTTTTNGTRALRACAGAKTVLAAALLNLTATVKYIRPLQPTHVLLVCAGTHENTALEDVLAAGKLCDLLSGDSAGWALSDSAEIAWRTYAQAKSDLAAAICASENARRLLAIPELRDDVAFCLRNDAFNLVAIMEPNGTIRRG
jgi:2-phosphosulfolactate phosphatase